jgi:hypothetical protein
LLEALAETEHAAVYRALLARDLALADEVDAARDDLSGAFLTLARRRVEGRRALLLGRYEAAPTEENLAAYREADEQYRQLRQQSAASAGPPARS